MLIAKNSDSTQPKYMVQAVSLPGIRNSKLISKTITS